MGKTIQLIFGIGILSLISCTSSDTLKEETKPVGDAIEQEFVIALEKLSSPDLPYVQSSAVGVTEDGQYVFIGGRKEGFHGLESDTSTFSKKYANQTISIIDFANFTSSGLAITSSSDSLLAKQMMSTNMLYYQQGDTLFLVGGYGIRKTEDENANYTFPFLTALSISKLVDCVRAHLDPVQAKLFRIEDPYFQVTGGEMLKIGGYYYLVMGQNYEGSYSLGLTGKYTEAFRRFSLNKDTFSDTLSVINPEFHRRDLNVTRLIDRENELIGVYGGVFTDKGNGWQKPIYFTSDGSYVIDTLKQLTNQYNSAKLNIYNASINRNTIVMLGGIGQYQYDEAIKTWEDGDQGAKLPFVNSITQMVYQDGVSQQFTQIPPEQPVMPSFIGASATMILNPDLELSTGVVDWSKLSSDTTELGVLFGGISSMKPTSSSIYPTSLNKSIYKVSLIKL